MYPSSWQTRLLTIFNQLKAMYRCCHPPPAALQLWKWNIDPVTFMRETTEPEFAYSFYCDPVNFFLAISWVNVLSCSCEWQIRKDYAVRLRCYRLLLRYYSHVLYRVTDLKKSERFGSLPGDFISTRLHRWHFPGNIQYFFVQAISQNSYTDSDGFSICLVSQIIIVSVGLRESNYHNVIGEIP